MLGFTMAIGQSESRTQACHVRFSNLVCVILLFTLALGLDDAQVSILIIDLGAEHHVGREVLGLYSSTIL